MYDENSTAKRADIGGVSLYFNDVGAGTPIVCLHGSGPGATSWNNFSRNVEAFAKSHRVILLDMPQYGRSAKIKIDGGRLTGIATIISRFLKEQGIGAAHFVGNSFGGQVSLCMAINYAHLVRSVTIIGSTPLASVLSPMPAEAVKHIANYYRGEGPSLAKMKNVLQALVFDTSYVTDELVKARYEASCDPELIALYSGAPMARQELTRAELATIKAKTLIVWGMDDRGGPLDVGIAMNRAIADSRMYLFNRCGHWAQVEHADEFNSLVVGFIDQIDASSQRVAS